MCGILGYSTQRKGFKFSNEDFIQTLKHRGPDGDGIYDCNEITLLHTRLSIVDIDFGKQPVEFENLVIVFNGEIYNHKDLRNSLISNGYAFETGSDTEVLIKAYHFYGKDLTKYINGMYAFAIFNKKDKSLLLCRDRFGIKPLYLFHTNQDFVFASEMKSIIYYLRKNNIEFQLNEKSLIEYLQSGQITSSKLFDNLVTVAPGEYLELSDGKISKTRCEYNTFQTNASLEEILQVELSEQLEADVEVGILLSGGIDSSLLTAISSNIKHDLKTFSVVFDQKSDLDESIYSQEVAQRFKTNHYEYIFTEKDLIDLIPTLTSTMDLPIYDPAMLPLLFLSEKVSKKVKVAICGDGGDEIFAGYTHHRVLKYKKIFKTLNFLIRFFKRDAPLSLVLNRIFDRNETLEESLSNDLHKNLDKRLLRKSDLCSMKFGLELRVPYLSNRVLDFSNMFNRRDFINIFFGKMPLRKLVSKLISKKVAYKKKQGFRIPIKDWIQGDLGEEVQNDLYKNLSLPKSVVNQKAVKEILKNKEENYEYIFKLFILNRWFIANFKNYQNEI
tara:strand:+ start:3253 stop:4920 length:1668 start_codon:yes stop_codon:yes gene_type:complete